MAPNKLKRPVLGVQPFECWLAIVALYAGLSHFIPIAPSGPAAAVELKFPALVPVWSVMYALGGLGIVVGLLWRSPRIEGAGISLLAGGAAVAFLATLLANVAVLPTVVGLGGIVVACLLRLRLLVRLMGRPR